MKKPDTAAVLRALKDFQRATVDYVFERLYLDPHTTRRFLVADEVGLGKTLVARGVVAKVIDHLWGKVKRVDIIYVCSNADIARQNIRRLKLDDEEDFTQASRITLLPVSLKDLKQKPLNFISLTPMTSFDLKSNLGTQKERALLYWLLQEAWGLKGAAPLNVLQGHASRDSFRSRIDAFRDDHEIDEGLAAEFRRAIENDASIAGKEGRRDLRSRFEALSERFGRAKDNVPEEDHRERTAVVGELRAVLAVTCLESLEPDLVILDEFQRFKHLLDESDPSGLLAHKLFEFQENRILLLSATPYKMYTLEQEAETDDHYQDFLTTLGFLQKDAAATSAFATLLRDHRRDLFALDQGSLDRLVMNKRRMEEALRRVVARTERLAVSNDRNGMLTEVARDPLRISSRDVTNFLTLEKVAHEVDEAQALEYWKASPYLLNFMDDYALKKRIRDAVEEGSATSSRIARLVEDSPGLLLTWADVAAYAEVDPGNARLRDLFDDTVGRDLWKLLWIPPSLPYYELDGVYRDVANQPHTKRLVFSCWRVVPKAIASLLSYEAERRMFRSQDPGAENTPEARKRRKGLLRFSRDKESTGMRLTGMPVLGMLYPSPMLARACDPLAPGATEDGRLPSLTELVDRARAAVAELLSRVDRELRGKAFESSSDTAPDESWYWAAPILFDLLDNPIPSREWLRRDDCAQRWSGETSGLEEDGEPSAWQDHVEKARSVVRGLTRLRLGPPPPDLADVLAWMGLAGPGVVALRSMGRITGGGAWLESPAIRDAAGSVAWSMRTLFNLPEVTALVRGLDAEEPYWLKAVQYCAKGGIQSVLDEYAHVLRESLGLLDAQPEELARIVADAMREALGLRTAALGVDVFNATNGSLAMARHRMRARFALRFGKDESDDDEESNRTEQVRTAFNSPFWPFVLATTSVGQEGLDFHQFCHAVVHWNLPANPVDLEQREGRVHRYKGHAVRKNVAQRYGLDIARGHASDPWEALFVAAKRDNASESDIVPYWVFPVDGGARIERHVPAFPLSKEISRLTELRRSLAAYRIVFGQARQEELISYLLTRMPEGAVGEASERLRIDLTPPSARDRANP
jgi:hypothetical protein